MFTITRAVWAICSSTSGRVRVPPRRVTEPEALIIGVTPNRRYACSPGVEAPDCVKISSRLVS